METSKSHLVRNFLCNVRLRVKQGDWRNSLVLSEVLTCEFSPTVWELVKFMSSSPKLWFAMKNSLKNYFRRPKGWLFWILKNLVSGRVKKILRTIGSLLDTWSDFTTFCQGPSIKNCETSNCPSKEFYQKNATNFTTRAANFEIRRFHVRKVRNLRLNFWQKKLSQE